LTDTQSSRREGEGLILALSASALQVTRFGRSRASFSADRVSVLGDGGLAAFGK
jgi:hypothetical protein